MSQVLLSIDDGDPLPATPTGGVLYTLPWEPLQYSSGLHTIDVFVKVNYLVSRLSHDLSHD